MSAVDVMRNRSLRAHDPPVAPERPRAIVREPVAYSHLYHANGDDGEDATGDDPARQAARHHQLPPMEPPMEECCMLRSARVTTSTVPWVPRPGSGDAHHDAHHKSPP